jgi:hypothetical protein
VQNWLICIEETTLNRIISTSGTVKIIKGALSKNGTGRPTKDRRDIDEFGNEIKTDEEEED